MFPKALKSRPKCKKSPNLVTLPADNTNALNWPQKLTTFNLSPLLGDSCQPFRLSDFCHEISYKDTNNNDNIWNKLALTTPVIVTAGLT